MRKLVSFGLGGMDALVAHGHSETRELQNIFPTIPILTLFHPIYDIFPGENIPKREARQGWVWRRTPH
jgi:hypothetical protein